jgi:hypothetical protein
VFKPRVLMFGLATANHSQQHSDILSKELLMWQACAGSTLAVLLWDVAGCIDSPYLPLRTAATLVHK